MEDRIFKGKDSVVGMPAIDFMAWAGASTTVMTSIEKQPTPPYGVLALPAVQRTALWSPRQIVDLWDSLFRGLPIGSFFLVRRSCDHHSQVRTLLSSAPMVSTTQPGFDLLDGQQRARAMLLGLMGPELEPRCLWVDLGADSKSHLIRLHLTSASQPFGYDSENGQKLPLNERRHARIEFDKANIVKPTKDDSNGAEHCCYDYELFDLFLRPNRLGAAPIGLRPWRASKLTYPLHQLLSGWLEKSGSGVEYLRGIFGFSDERDVNLDRRIKKLDEAFQRIVESQVALVQVDPTRFQGGAHEGLLTLFDRIGAGGTQLTAEERLFSIYKHHKPLVHNLVLRIYEEVGRVLPPTKIVTSAIRIANARVHLSPLEGNSVPDVGSFAKEMASGNSEILDKKRTKSLRVELDELLPPSLATGNGKLAGCLSKVFSMIRHSKTNRLGIPKVMLAELSAQLLQVLLLWALSMYENGQDAAIQASGDDAIRFVMFWRLCVRDEDKASTDCFELLRSRTDITTPIFLELYRTLVTKLYVWPLITPDEMDVVGRHPPSSVWLKAEERFKAVDGAPIGLYRTWWESRKKFLMWLQRDYLSTRFDDFDPLSGRDDDMPFELDHICPSADWGRNWSPFRTALKKAGCLTEKELDAMRDARFVLGNSIGNFRLVDARINEGDGDAPIAIKMPYVACDDPLSEDSIRSMAEIAFSPEHRAMWLQASGPAETSWDEERLKAWQHAVEERTLWLYRRFYDDLGFKAWQ